MKWKIVLVCLVGGIIYENIGAKIVKPNHNWFSQIIGGLRSNRQNENCPNTCRCGVPNKKTRIIGGHPARLVDFPWIGMVQSQTENGTFNCGGSLINDRYILTAAHCIKSNASNTYAILQIENTKNYTSIAKFKGIKEVLVHPGWNPKISRSNDIALIKLNKPMKFDIPSGAEDYIAPLCVAKDPAQSYYGVNASSIGWGLTDGNDLTSKSPQLLEVFVDVVKDDNCERQLGKGRYDSKTMICAGTSDGKLGTCTGDSGGPLHHRATASDGTLYHEEIGLTSFGGKLCDTHSVYTKLTTYGDWITENTADACECARPS